MRIVANYGCTNEQQNRWAVKSYTVEKYLPRSKISPKNKEVSFISGMVICGKVPAPEVESSDLFIFNFFDIFKGNF